MIQTLKPYSAYKDSGVPWLGEVPEHWERLPGRSCYSVRQVPNKGLQEKTVLSLSYGQIKVKPEEKLHGLVPASFETYQIVEAGDIICRPTDLQNDWNSLRFGLSRNRGIITSAYMCFHTHASLTREYGHLLLHTYDLKKVFYGLGSGLRQNLEWKDFKYLPCLVPPLPEQSAIVQFLDHADRRIRRYIRAKQKLITLLSEQKQAIIHRAVTRGLDPNVRLKPSGVEWLGDVPEHWEVIRFKFVAAKIVDCLHATPKYSESGEFPAIRTADIFPGMVHLTSARRIESDEYARWVERLEPKPGDILYSREGERFGIAACVPDGARLCISQRMMVFRIRSDYNPVFVMWLLNSRQAYAQACQDVMGATAPHVNVSTIRNYFLALPTRDEQDSLVSEIENSTREFSSVITNAVSEIELLREYRTRLIADVVTGKLDVRETAAQLPEEAEEPEALGEADSLSEAEADAADDLEATHEEAET
jgi:type I restriction enzyme, S subunit